MRVLLARTAGSCCSVCHAGPCPWMVLPVRAPAAGPYHSPTPLPYRQVGQLVRSSLGVQGTVLGARLGAAGSELWVRWTGGVEAPADTAGGVCAAPRAEQLRRDVDVCKGMATALAAKWWVNAGGLLRQQGGARTPQEQVTTPGTMQTAPAVQLQAGSACSPPLPCREAYNVEQARKAAAAAKAAARKKTKKPAGEELAPAEDGPLDAAAAAAD